METSIYKTKQEMGTATAYAAQVIKEAIENKGLVNIGPRAVKKKVTKYD
ncbi:MAG: hypothetical protein ABIL62_02570 [Planctomycetota bacterium]